MNEVYTDYENILTRYQNLLKEARALFPHSTFVTILVNTSEKDKKDFNEAILSGVNQSMVIGNKMEGREFVSYQFNNTGKIKLEI